MTHVSSTLSACLCPDLRGCNWQVSVSENWWRPGVSNPSRQDACKATPQPSAAPILFGIDPRTRTLTDSFGDCSAAITLGGCIILVEQRGFEPLQHYWPPGYSRVPFLSGVYSIKLIWSPAWHCSAGNCVVFKTWRCVGESNSHLRIDNPR